MTTGERTDPYLGFRFAVEIDSLIVAGFSRVEGLGVELETKEYEEGGVNTHSHVLPGRMNYQNVTLERGLTDSEVLWEWLVDAKHGTPERRNGRVLLYDSTGAEVGGWEFHDAYPVRWEGPELSADRGQVAIETLELAHEGLTRHGGG